mgnify:CR=1 FL=1
MADAHGHAVVIRCDRRGRAIRIGLAGQIGVRVVAVHDGGVLVALVDQGFQVLPDRHVRRSVRDGDPDPARLRVARPSARGR